WISTPTRSPVEGISPENSCPGMCGNGVPGNWPAKIFSSVPQIVTERTRTSTWPGPATGMGTSSLRSNESGAVRTRARTAGVEELLLRLHEHLEGAVNAL